jgi:hypothetical protein
VFATADQDLGLNPDFAEFSNTLLGWFGFQLSRRFNKGDEGDVDEQAMARPGFEGELPQGFEKG